MPTCGAAFSQHWHVFCTRTLAFPKARPTFSKAPPPLRPERSRSDRSCCSAVWSDPHRPGTQSLPLPVLLGSPSAAHRPIHRQVQSRPTDRWFGNVCSMYLRLCGSVVRCGCVVEYSSLWLVPRRRAVEQLRPVIHTKHHAGVIFTAALRASFHRNLFGHLQPF